MSFWGLAAGLNATTACFNVFVGGSGKTGTVTGNKNVALGYAASCNITSGNHNVTIGQNAGRDISTGCYNIFLGSCAGNTTNATGSNNIMIGSATLKVQHQVLTANFNWTWAQSLVDW